MRAQVMVITLLTLMVLGIITVGVVLTASRDVFQTVSNQQYEIAYNAAEEEVFTFLDKYARSNSGGTFPSLAEVTTDFPGACTQVTLGVSYYCSFLDTATSVQTELQIRDVTSFTDYEVVKDDSLSLNINGYRGEVRMSWQNSAAIEISLIYTTAAGEYRIIKDLFDPAALLTASGGNPFVNSPGDGHAIVFSTYQSPFTNSFRFTVGNTLGIGATDVPRLLIITPRIPTAGRSIRLSFNYDGSLGQMREFVGVGRLAGVLNSPVPSVRTYVPLYPQSLNIFNGYSLATEGQIVK